MFIATLLKPRPRATTSSSSPARQSRMLQRRAMRPRHLNSSFQAAQHIVAASMESLADEFIPVAPAIADIDVVDVVSDLPSLPEATQPADMGPNGFVDSAEAASVESVDAVPGMTPVCADAASIEVAPMVLMEKIAATPSATITATAEPNVQVVTEIITAAPAIGPTADTVTSGALPTTPKKVKNPRRKPENEGLGGGAVKAKKPRSKSGKKSSISGTADLTASDSAHSP